MDLLLYNDKIKMLQINKLYYPWIGGVETVVKQIADGLKNDFQIDVLVCQSKGERKTEEIEGIKIYRAKSFKILFGMPISLDFFRLYKKIADNYDLIFFHHPFPLADLALFLFKTKKKIAVYYHSDIVRQKLLEFLFRPLIFNTLKKSSKIFVSNPNMIETSPYLKKFKDKCFVLPFGIRLEMFNKNQKILTEIEKIKEKYGSPLVLSAGRLAYYKGFEYLIPASKNIDAKFLIIGGGPLEGKIRSLIDKHKLQNKFFIIPLMSQEKLVPYYYACDIFILPSVEKSEAFGIVLLEAMACGKPIISTELGTGTSFINQNQKTGLVIKPRDISEIELSIKKLLLDNYLKETMEKLARKRAEKFSIESFLEKLKKELIF